MTTIVLVRKNNEVVVAGDGQVSMGNTVVKSTASKVRKIEKREINAIKSVNRDNKIKRRKGKKNGKKLNYIYIYIYIISRM